MSQHPPAHSCMIFARLADTLGKAKPQVIVRLNFVLYLSLRLAPDSMSLNLLAMYADVACVWDTLNPVSIERIWKIADDLQGQILQCTRAQLSSNEAQRQYAPFALPPV